MNATFWYGSGGSLLCDREIEGLTQELTTSTAAGYGGDYFVGESMSESAAKQIVAALGGQWRESKPE